MAIAANITAMLLLPQILPATSVRLHMPRQGDLVLEVFDLRLTFANFVPDGYGLTPDKAVNLRFAYDLAQQYAENPEGWLVLFGGYGCGKTHLAAAVANERHMHGEPVIFVTAPDLLDHLRATFSPDSTSSMTKGVHIQTSTNATATSARLGTNSRAKLLASISGPVPGLKKPSR